MASPSTWHSDTHCEHLVDAWSLPVYHVAALNKVYRRLIHIYLLGRGLAVDVEDIKDLLSILPIRLEKQQTVIRKKKMAHLWS